MGFAIKDSGGKKEKPPVGNHLAVCVAIIDMGDQEQTAKKNGVEELYWAHRAYFIWELCDEQIAGTGKNHVIGADLTLTMSDRGKLPQWVKARCGVVVTKDWNPLSELGQPCMLNVVPNGDYVNVGGMAGLAKSLAANPPKPTYPLTSVSLEEFREGKAIPEWVPWLFGNPVEAYLRASREMGGVLGVTRAQLRKKADAPAAGTSLGQAVPF